MGYRPGVDRQAEDDLLDLAVRIEHVADVHQVAAAGVLHEYALSESAGGLLWVLALGPSPMTMREVASRLRCDPSNVTLLSERLEEAGLAERVPDQHDARRRIVRLTNQGQQVWSRVCEAVVAASPLTRLPALIRDELAAALAPRDGLEPSRPPGSTADRR